MKRKSTNLRKLGLLIAPFFLLTYCDDNQPLHSPTMAVDLSPRLPEKASRRAVSGITYYCKKDVGFAEAGGAQKFLISWRVIDIDKVRYIVAAEVSPMGKTSGAKNPKASATVGANSALDQDLTVRVYWGARSGCSTVEATKTFKLSPKDASCKLAQP